MQTQSLPHSNSTPHSLWTTSRMPFLWFLNSKKSNTPIGSSSLKTMLVHTTYSIHCQAMDIWHHLNRSPTNHSIKKKSTAQETWNRIKNIFQENKNTRTVNLENQFNTLHLSHFPNVTTYCQQIKSISDQLANIRPTTFWPKDGPSPHRRSRQDRLWYRRNTHPTDWPPAFLHHVKVSPPSWRISPSPRNPLLSSVLCGFSRNHPRTPTSTAQYQWRKPQQK